LFSTVVVVVENTQPDHSLATAWCWAGSDDDAEAVTSFSKRTSSICLEYNVLLFSVGNLIMMIIIMTLLYLGNRSMP
jgi:hypothetical protein